MIKRIQVAQEVIEFDLVTHFDVYSFGASFFYRMTDYTAFMHSVICHRYITFW